MSKLQITKKIEAVHSSEINVCIPDMTCAKKNQSITAKFIVLRTVSVADFKGAHFN